MMDMLSVVSFAQNMQTHFQYVARHSLPSTLPRLLPNNKESGS